jgi:hypothetical protein
MPRKAVEFTGQRHCPHCGGLHYGQRFDDCPYLKLVNDPNATEEQRANAKSFLDAHQRDEANKDAEDPRPKAKESSVNPESLPLWKSHKKVRAVKIKSVVFDWELARAEDRETDGGATITPEEPGIFPFKVNRNYVNKHDPTAGGYYVLYEDGYESWSPAEAFESGYTRI